MSGDDAIAAAKVRAFEQLKAEIQQAKDQRVSGWFDGSWLLFEGAKKLRVQHLTLRRWRLLRGSGILDEGAVDVERVLFFLSPDFRYQNDRALRRWKRKVRKDLSCREALSQALDDFYEMTFGPASPEATRDAGQDQDGKRPEQKKPLPWEIFNAPEDEVYFICELGPILGGAEAVLDFPIARLRQLVDWMKYQDQDPQGPRFTPGDKWRKRWDAMLEEVEMGIYPGAE